MCFKTKECLVAKCTSMIEIAPPWIFFWFSNTLWGVRFMIHGWKIKWSKFRWCVNFEKLVYYVQNSTLIGVHGFSTSRCRWWVGKGVSGLEADAFCHLSYYNFHNRSNFEDWNFERIKVSRTICCFPPHLVYFTSEFVDLFFDFACNSWQRRARKRQRPHKKVCNIGTFLHKKQTTKIISSWESNGFQLIEKFIFILLESSTSQVLHKWQCELQDVFIS